MNTKRKRRLVDVYEEITRLRKLINLNETCSYKYILFDISKISGPKIRLSLLKRLSLPLSSQKTLYNIYSSERSRNHNTIQDVVVLWHNIILLSYNFIRFQFTMRLLTHLYICFFILLLKTNLLVVLSSFYRTCIYCYYISS